MGDPVTMLQYFKDHAVTVAKAQDMSAAELADRFTIGVLTDVDKPDYIKEYQKIRDIACKSKRC
jgi:2-oxoglutarate ferredoxin oxidoreductase subunit beta